MKLLRKIRQQVVLSGKVKQYALYAIGEIFLVVVGILIALQINNWNEEYKDRQLEESYYFKFLEAKQCFILPTTPGKKSCTIP